MDLEQFRRHIKTVSHVTLDAYHDEIAGKFKRARDPQIKLGYAIALDELAIESQMRKSTPPNNMTDDELLEALLLET